MDLGKIFDHEVQESSFDPIPAGWYQARISEAEVKATKNNDGHYLNVRYDILGPTHQGRVVFGMITINNPSRKAEEIGEQQMAHLRSALGLKKVTNTDQLINGTVEIKVNVKKDDQYGDKNEIKAWKAVTGGVPPMPKQAQSEESTEKPSAPPWARG